MTAAPLRIGILAGESSGDILGAGLMRALRQRVPSCSFEGIGGPLMAAEGLCSRVPMERLSVMGLVEPLKRLPELLRIRRELIQHFSQTPPDLFIGIDSPDFNIAVELALRQQGIPTVHYVSPSVWAWRQRRIHKIARAVDLVLALLPFEAAFYERHQVPVAFVGHPLADDIALEPDVAAARAALNLPPDSRVLAVLPGSRQGELARLGPVFLDAVALLQAHQPALTVLLPCASPARRSQMESLLRDQPRASVTLLDGQSRTAMAAADAVLLASGTATLEALLLKKPMLVCYRMGWLSYQLISRLLRVPYFSLPNLLSGQALVEELAQQAVTAPALCERLQVLLDPAAGKRSQLLAQYHIIHQTLRRQASDRAAEAVLPLVRRELPPRASTE